MSIPGWLPVTVYAIILLGFLAVYSYFHLGDGSERPLFVAIVAFIAIALLGDGVSRCYEFDGFSPILIRLGTYFNYGAIPIIGALWYFYVRSMLNAHERSRTRIPDKAVIVLLVIALATLISNPLTHVVFSFDAQGIYHREALYFFPAGAAFWCIIIAEGFLITCVRSVAASTMGTLLFFPLPPLLGAVGATILYGVPWMLLGMSISMVVLFANTQTVGLNTDYLTSALNKKRIEEVLDERVIRAKEGPSFAGIMLDLDNFKTINDTLGHTVGDRVLEQSVAILRLCIREGDMVGRVGGDEFFIVMDIEDKAVLKQIVDRIDAQLGVYNEAQEDYQLEMSKGYDIFDSERFSTREEFMAYLDELMYQDKERHHALRTSALRKSV